MSDAAVVDLRPYQREAVDAVWAHVQTRSDNPCVVIPTGGGKTPVMATLCHDLVGWGRRAVILAHVKELLEQSADKLRAMAPGVPVGVYSAGLGQRDLEYAVTVAGIQSIYKRAPQLGRVDCIIVDEAHMIPPDGEGMYQRFIADARVVNPRVRIVGLTATPYRMKSGSICGPDNILNHVCYEVGVRELIVQGYLSGLRSRAGEARIDTAGVHVRGGEFVAEELEAAANTDELVALACREIIEQADDRKAVLIFAAGVAHAQHIVAEIQRQGYPCGLVTGDTPPGERAAILDRFRAGGLKYLANINVLTTGFDAPHIDCVALLRPTMSPGLYYQMVGRGFRLAPGKTDCLVLDFGGNVLRHGPVDMIDVASRPGGGAGEAPVKECPQCHEIVLAGYAVCPLCDYRFPEPERRAHGASASSAAVLSGDITTETYEVLSTSYHVHIKRDDPSAPLTMRVEYDVGLSRPPVREWVCLDHDGYARAKAEAWWRRRSTDPIPEGGVVDAVSEAALGALIEPARITVQKKSGEKYERVIAYELPTREEAVAAKSNMPPDDEIPF